MEQTSPYHCDCTEKQIRRRTYRNGTTHFVEQCLRCGTSGRSLAKQSREVHLALNDGGITDFDEGLHDRFWATATKQIAQQRQKKNEEWWAYYQAYITSDDWRAKRAKVLERDGGICQGCLTRAATQVHHLSYKHLGAEYAWELVSICDECHSRLTETERGLREAIYGPDA